MAYIGDMAEWIKCKYTKGKIDRAAESLIPWWKGDAGAPEELADYYQIIQNWRNSHAMPLLTFRMGLEQRAKRIELEIIVAQRMKRFSSVMNKLSREKRMKAGGTPSTPNSDSGVAGCPILGFQRVGLGFLSTANYSSLTPPRPAAPAAQSPTPSPPAARTPNHKNPATSAPCLYHDFIHQAPCHHTQVKKHARLE
jgi:hypothetical protein